MNLIKSVNELEQLLQGIEGKKPLTNCYFYGNEFASLIKQDLLYYQTIGSNLFLFKSKLVGQYFDMYYYIVDDQFTSHFKYDVPIVLEIPYRGSIKFPHIEVDFLIKCGFSMHINRDLMFLNKPDLSQIKLSAKDAIVKILDDESIVDVITTSITETFDYYTGDILPTNKVKESLENKEILGVYMGDSLAGFLRFYTKNKISWIGHIAVFDEFAGKGLGKVLVYEYLKHQIVNDIHSFQHWVVSTNTAALRLYEYFCFAKMNKCSISLLNK
jgi:ribosomal protein S18 acetylase RimI-like enzyme